MSRQAAFKHRKGDEAFSLEVGTKEAFAARQAHLFGQQGNNLPQLVQQQLAEQQQQTGILRDIAHNTAGDTSQTFGF